MSPASGRWRGWCSRCDLFLRVAAPGPRCHDQIATPRLPDSLEILASSSRRRDGSLIVGVVADYDLAMPLAVGQVFAGFRILRVLGAGAMGKVYLAEHPRLPRH